MAAARDLGGTPCVHLTANIPPVKRTLAAGPTLDVSGSGEAWIAAADGRVLRVTELIEGQARNDKASAEPGRLLQRITLADAAQPAPAPSAPEAAPPAAPPSAPKPAAPAAASAPTPAPAPAASAAAPAPAPALAPAAAAAASSSTGLSAERLMYVSNATGKREIWSLAPDGAVKACLSGYAFDHWAPAFESTGRILACAGRKAPGGVNVWLLRLGQGAAALTDFAESDDMLVGWAAAATRVAFVRRGQFWLAEPDGFNLQTIPVDGRVVDLAATPASTRVALVANTLNQNRIVTVETGSGVVRDIADGDRPSFSPDASRIAYRGGDGLMVMQADGSAPSSLAKTPMGDGPLVWDPAGTRIAFTGRAGDMDNVMMLDVARGGGSPVAVTTRGGVAQAFSPDGKRIAYLFEGDLWIATLDGATLTRLTSDGTVQPPVWWGRHYVP